VPVSGSLARQIATLLINRANDTYSRTCSSNGMIYLDLRGTTGGRWYDEIHPKEEAFRDFAMKFISAIPRQRTIAKKHSPARKSRLSSRKSRGR
jgi:hypothetical protein